ncbi:stage V sporulation protein AA [Thermicanus aegyptius]|uniref:stage V sporulation protein AA n=1 Tax=Thermicanus aegyptius TaxID=94009 RepID=UPI0004243A3C|nr:stage V sporulation protein AA [Thermicanus aegyptius]
MIGHAVYLRLRRKVTLTSSRKQVTLDDVAQIVAPSHVKTSLKGMTLQQITPADGNLFVIDAMTIIEEILKSFPDLMPHVIGDEETLVEVKEESGKKAPLWKVASVWLLLFLGSGLAIMNFHTDVSMGKVHERFYYLLTGKVNPHPYLLQIPYSVGIGIGMILFFNHLFRKRLNEEPSPLELEMYLYQENVEKFAKDHENRENRKGEDASTT